MPVFFRGDVLISCDLGFLLPWLLRHETSNDDKGCVEESNSIIVAQRFIKITLGPVNTYFAPALLHKKRGGKARSAGHSMPMAKLRNAVSAFFGRNPKGRGRILSSPSLLAAYGGLLRCATHASSWMKSVPVAGAK
ncbi:hypothetical protein SQ11_14870 [Nitrosospira sp. NpAV]|nr:hypothetical protein SQ11_14870 [Nitrosospira sp. NpAV]